MNTLGSIEDSRFSPRVLILGGTEEARLLADALSQAVPVITSLAGRTTKPGRVAGMLRTGGFGGVEGLARYLTETKIEVIVDATHPYAARMGWNAVAAAQACGVPCIRLARPLWEKGVDDNWIAYSDAVSVAAALPAAGQRVFLALGGADLAAFQSVRGTHMTIRAIDPPSGFEGRGDVEVLLARGPFDLAAETALLSARAIDLVVSRNAGGRATWAKIEAARMLGIRVAMIDRPPRPNGPSVSDVSAAKDWVLERLEKK